MSRKIVVKLMGGLGNQLFQYSYAYLISKKFNYDSIVLDNRLVLKNNAFNTIEDFVLDSKSMFSREKQKYDAAVKRNRIYQYIYAKLHGHRPNCLNNRLLKKGFLFCGRYCELPEMDLPDDIYLYGYFQDAYLIDEVRDDLVKATTLKNKREHLKNYEKVIKANSVSISVRTLTEAERKKGVNFVYSGKNYYINLVKKIQDKRQEKLQLVITANDIKRIKEEGWFDGFEDVIYVEDCSPTEQLTLMKQCRDFILSNSSFSWWGAYLGSYKKDSIVIFPPVWYGGDKTSTTKLLFDGIDIAE